MAVFKGSTDQPAKKDIFGIGNYISGLCSFITECDTPMTIAIQGDWGSGKTSIMEMVREKIDKKSVHCVWFNTWQYSQFNTADNLSLALIDKLIESLGIDGDGHVQKLRSGISKLGSFIAGVGKTAVVVSAEILSKSQVFAEIVNDALTKNSDKALNDKAVNDTIESFKEQFQKCVDKAVEERKVDRLLVFIDDLDRLQPLRAVELLEVLKIFLDCEKCVFILALDYNVVVSGVKRKYGADIKADKGRSFFDKIIQVPFKMPVAQYDISSFVKNTLEDVTAIKFGNDDIENFVSLINCSIGSNPRSMKRLFNSYLLLIKVIDKEMIENYDSKKALFAILCMQQRFENLYNYIVLNRDSKGEINAEFFNMLADSDSPGTLLEDKGIETEDGEPEVIREFISGFNRTLGINNGVATAEDSVDRLRGLLRSSSVTATETAPAGVRKRPTFVYKGDTYMTQGANKMNLSNLALRLIKDYARENNTNAEDLINMINSSIPCYNTLLKNSGIRQIAARTNPQVKKKDVQELLFTEKDEPVALRDGELLVSRCWGVGELSMLIELFKYTGRVSSNVINS